LELTADKIGVLGTTINTSNRTTLWFYGLDQLGQRALLGFGIEGFWTPERIQAFKDIYGWVLDNFHNGYITILIGGGIVGILLLLLAISFIVLLFMVSIGNLRDPYLTLAFGYTNMFLVGNLVENELGRSTSPQFIMFLIIPFALRPYVSRIAGVPDASGLAHPKAVPA
jgi:O-antigen ligase